MRQTFRNWDGCHTVTSTELNRQRNSKGVHTNTNKYRYTFSSVAVFSLSKSDLYRIILKWATWYVLPLPVRSVKFRVIWNATYYKNKREKGTVCGFRTFWLIFLAVSVILFLLHCFGVSWLSYARGKEDEYIKRDVTCLSNTTFLYLIWILCHLISSLWQGIV